MYYASIGIIALIVTTIVNLEALRKVENKPENKLRLKYRQYILALLTFFVSDILWGILYELHLTLLTYIDTVVFFIAMVTSVLLWTRAVVIFTKSSNRLSKIFLGAGWIIYAFEIVVLAVNIFKPIAFGFDADGVYETYPARYITLFMQMILFLATAIYSFVVSARSVDKKRFHYKTVGFSGLIMSVFIELQMLFPLMPFYSMGCLFGTCIIHTFVYKDKDIEFTRAVETATQKAYRDGLTGVKNKLAYLEALAEIETHIEDGTLKEYGVVVFDLNGLKKINDTLGHEAGDEYIKNGCALICTKFDHSPVFRIGGDEFVTILKGQDYENRERLESEFRSIIDQNQKDGKVVVSSGLAIHEEGRDESYNDVFKRADACMYERKKSLKAM